MEKLIFKELKKETWHSFEQLLGERGACGGCWCMSWRLGRSEFEKNKGAGNKSIMKSLADSGERIGLIAFDGEKPVGWCSVAPREVFVRLKNSRVLKPVDEKPVWSVSCFFIAKDYRRQGLSTELLKGVITHCKEKGARIIEAYPTEPYSNNIPAAFAWTGIPASFIKAGFIEVERRSKTRPIMRYFIK
ncbi:MAG: GNAT family N-acetyltransferase [Ignavibacteriaceae bacterium]|nr:GNAT family N-acetyltransferase [Ignavibacteriaceae bacterium]